ncbi:MAG: hypothetical protein QW582_00115 [Candidatus Micrarchaeaceae archaeon]
MIAILLSYNAVNVLFPIVIIAILILAAAGLNRGAGVFDFMGIGTLLGLGGAVGGGRVKGLSKKPYYHMGRILVPKTKKGLVRISKHTKYTELQSIPEIGEKEEAALKAKGINTVKSLANASPTTVVNAFAAAGIIINQNKAKDYIKKAKKQSFTLKNSLLSPTNIKENTKKSVNFVRLASATIIGHGPNSGKGPFANNPRPRPRDNYIPYDRVKNIQNAFGNEAATVAFLGYFVGTTFKKLNNGVKNLVPKEKNKYTGMLKNISNSMSQLTNKAIKNATNTIFANITLEASEVQNLPKPDVTAAYKRLAWQHFSKGTMRITDFLSQKSNVRTQIIGGTENTKKSVQVNAVATRAPKQNLRIRDILKLMPAAYLANMLSVNKPSTIAASQKNDYVQNRSQIKLNPVNPGQYPSGTPSNPLVNIVTSNSASTITLTGLDKVNPNTISAVVNNPYSVTITYEYYSFRYTINIALTTPIVSKQASQSTTSIVSKGTGIYDIIIS